jgi:hypothetical protein
MDPVTVTCRYPNLGFPSRSATPPQAAEILGFGDFSSATKTGDVADGNGRKPAENLICGGVADRKRGSGRKRYDGRRGDL